MTTGKVLFLQHYSTFPQSIVIGDYTREFMMVQIGKIIITDRIRKEITKIAELSEDIRSNGLINPITVMSLDGGEYQLLAGLRRLKAVELLGYSEIAIHVVVPADAETALRMEISENEQREEFTFTEKMDFARMLEAIEKEKAKERLKTGQSNGGKTAGNGRSKESSSPPHGAESKNSETRENVAKKIGMGKTTYDRAKYIADNAPEDVIDELDQGKRSIRGTYEELKAKEKSEKSTESSVSDDDLEDDVTDDSEIGMETLAETPKPSNTQKSSGKSKSENSYPAGLLSKADEEAIERNRKFHAMSDAEKVEELQRQLKEERKRAATAESELSRLKEFHGNAIYHKDGIIENLSARLKTAEARVDELEALYCSDSTN